MKLMLSSLSICIILISFVSEGYAEQETDRNLAKYVCEKRFFVVPESFDFRSVEEARLLTRANPERFEAHMVLAEALAWNGQYEEAIEEFKATDRLTSQVKDQSVLSGLQYERTYVFKLFAVAWQRYEKDPNDIRTLRMFQQVLGMDLSALKERKRLSQLYAAIATLYARFGSYDSALRFAESGKGVAIDEDLEVYVKLFEDVTTKAMRFKSLSAADKRVQSNVSDGKQDLHTFREKSPLKSAAPRPVRGSGR